MQFSETKKQRMLKGYGLRNYDFDITFDSEGTDDQIDTPTASEMIAIPRNYKKKNRNPCNWKSIYSVVDDELFQKKQSK